MSYSLIFGKSVEKDLKLLPKDYYSKIKTVLLLLTDKPRPTGCKKLKGYESTYRLRVGVYRIIYEVIDKIVTVKVIAVGHRKDIYD